MNTKFFLAGNRETAEKIVMKESPPLVALDLGLPPNPHSPDEGFATLHTILRAHPETKVIIITGNTEKAHALRAVSEGAHDFFSKPIDLDEIKITLRRSLNLFRLEGENRELQSRLAGTSISEIVGNSPAMEKVFKTIRKVATINVPVLITGETGTGKELVARTIHQNSLRRNKPFVPINCAAIPETLLESELLVMREGLLPERTTGSKAETW